MQAARTRLGDYLVAIEYDDSLGLFLGSVVNKRYPVRLSARSSEELEQKFRHLLTNYLGAEAT